jgi:hypothetical protein
MFVAEEVQEAIKDRATRDSYFKSKFYPKYRTEGYQVYWINTRQHENLTQGYIGIAPLCNRAIQKRYDIEVWYYNTFGDKDINRKYLLDNMIANYAELQFNILYSDLSKDMANAHERFLRPAGNYSDSRDLSNWNTKKGG